MSGGRRAWIGAAVWGVVAMPAVPNLHHGAWAQALTAFAALVLAPLLFDIVAAEAVGGEMARRGLAWAARLQLPAALLVAGSFRISAGPWALLMATPWAVVLLLLAMVGVARAVRRREAGVWPHWCGDAGLIYAAIGAAWLLADRGGLRPLGFAEDIVLLTAVHFHYAGLILPVLAGRALQRISAGWLGAAVSVGVMAGVPAVAVGITLSQVNANTAVETMAAGLMAVAGFAVAVTHLWLAMRDEPAPVSGSGEDFRPRSENVDTFTRGLWMIAGVSLAAGMVLAALYGLRNTAAPWPWLDIPWMRALHGSVNALGFALGGTLAWRRATTRSRGAAGGED